MIASKNTEELKKIINQQKREIESLMCKLNSHDVNQPENIISFETAQQLFANYDERAKIIAENVAPKGTKKFHPTRSIFVELNNLKLYLSYIEAKAAAAGITPTGLRFYLSVYDEEIKEEYADKTTFFIMPAANRDKEMNIGYTFAEDGKTPVFLDAETGFNEKSFCNKNPNLAKEHSKNHAFQLRSAASERNSKLDQQGINVFGGSPK